MRLDLSHIRQPDTLLERRYEPSAFAEGDEDYRVVERVALDGTIHKDKDRFRLAGTLVTSLELRCGRCLEPFRLPVDAHFDLRYLPEADATVGDGESEDVELGADDASATFYADDAIDLGDLMREQFYLALPMKPLCRADCKGLCPQCGTNLNTDTCQCQVRWEDPRLAGLKALIPDRKHDDA
jgi:uncharacterized protein